MRHAGIVYMGVMLCHISGAMAQAQIQTGIDPDAHMRYWQISDVGMSLRFVQRLPDQTRGYFQARGFADPEANLVARSCVFQTVFKNLSNRHQPSPLSYNLHDWIVSVAGHQQGMKLREDWQREWQQRNIPNPSQLAFEWSLYPTHQVYQPGDYNWGMSIFNLKPGTQFDLKVVWHQFGKTHMATIRKMQCAADIHPQPGSASKP